MKGAGDHLGCDFVGARDAAVQPYHQATLGLKQLADLGGADPGLELLRELFDLPDDGS